MKRRLIGTIHRNHHCRFVLLAIKKKEGMAELRISRQQYKTLRRVSCTLPFGRYYSIDAIYKRVLQFSHWAHNPKSRSRLVPDRAVKIGD